MAKNTNRAAIAIAYVAALGLAFGASAAHWELSTVNDVLYATEIFGDDADDIELSLAADDESNELVDNSTRVELTLVLPTNIVDDSETGDVDETDNTLNMDVGEGAEITVTFTLKDAVFGNTVGISDFETTDAEDNLHIVNGSKEGGRSGTNSVSIDLIAGGRDDSDMDEFIETGAMIVLTLESLEGAGILGRVLPPAAVTIVPQLKVLVDVIIVLPSSVPIFRSRSAGLWMFPDARVLDARMPTISSRVRRVR